MTPLEGIIIKNFDSELDGRARREHHVSNEMRLLTNLSKSVPTLHLWMLTRRPEISYEEASNLDSLSFISHTISQPYGIQSCHSDYHVLLTKSDLLKADVPVETAIGSLEAERNSYISRNSPRSNPFGPMIERETGKTSSLFVTLE